MVVGAAVPMPTLITPKVFLKAAVPMPTPSDFRPTSFLFLLLPSDSQTSSQQDTRKAEVIFIYVLFGPRLFASPLE